MPKMYIPTVITKYSLTDRSIYCEQLYEWKYCAAPYVLYILQHPLAIGSRSIILGYFRKTQFKALTNISFKKVFI